MSTADKQNYLYKEIIEADLDPEEFQLFLESRRPEYGLDITLWKFDELKEVVVWSILGREGVQNQSCQHSQKSTARKSFHREC